MSPSRRSSTSTRPRPAHRNGAGAARLSGARPSGARPRGAGAPTAPQHEHNRRIWVVVAALAALAVLPVWKFFSVLVAESDDLTARAVAQSTTRVDLAPTRGAITDRNGVEMAMSLPRVRVAVNRARLTELDRERPGVQDRFVRVLAEELGESRRAMERLLDASAVDDPWVKLVDDVTVERADAARAALLEIGLLDPLVYEDTWVREHPSGDSALRILGTLGPEGPGPLAGVEKSLDEELAGRPGRKVVEIAPGGNVIAGTEQVLEPAVAGSTVRLTLDRAIQFEVESALIDGAAKAGASGGVAVVGRPSTGEILAVASVERDPETGAMELAQSPKAFSDAYQPGSVLKLVPISAAIMDGVVELGTTFDVADTITLADRTFSDHDPHPPQRMTVEQILAQSSNVGTIQIAKLLGAERLHDALEDFGFGSRTGISHPAESPGILHPVQDWSTPDLGAAAIGTAQSVTAVQLWAAYNVIANRGEYVAPRLVDRVERADGTVVHPEDAVRRRVLPEAAAEQVDRALRAVITDGTGKAWDLPGFPVAAKTGTGRMPAPERSDAEDGYMWADGRYHYVNAFAGYLPADNPQVSVTVLLEDVTPGLTGSSGAGPVFSALARLSIRDLGIAPSGTTTSTPPLDASAPVESTTPPSPERPVRAAPAATSSGAGGDG